MSTLSLEGVEAVVYDLDGTLVRLAVDWEAVAADVTDELAERGIDATDGDLWAMLDRAEDLGHRETVETVIADHECAGARTAERLAFADTLADAAAQVPVGVCSLNCERACRVALEAHDLADRIEYVVGRDSVATRKPDPEPLLATVRGLSATPERTLFVGDSERDKQAAERAGTRFAYVGDGPTRY